MTTQPCPDSSTCSLPQTLLSSTLEPRCAGTPASAMPRRWPRQGRSQDVAQPALPASSPVTPHPRPRGTICSSQNMPRPPMLPAFASATSSACSVLLHPIPEPFLPGKLLPTLGHLAQASSSPKPPVLQARHPLLSGHKYPGGGRSVLCCAHRLPDSPHVTSGFETEGSGALRTQKALNIYSATVYTSARAHTHETCHRVPFLSLHSASWVGLREAFWEETAGPALSSKQAAQVSPQLGLGRSQSPREVCWVLAWPGPFLVRKDKSWAT